MEAGKYQSTEGSLINNRSNFPCT